MNRLSRLIIIFGLIQFLFLNIAKAQFSVVGTYGVCDMAYSIASDGTTMFVSINQSPAAGGGCGNDWVIWKWNGASWSNITNATGINGTVYTMVASGGYLYVGGEFTNVNGVAQSRIAKYNISTGVWSGLGTGCNGKVFSLAADATGSIIYVGGEFSTAGGTTVNRIAAWNTGSSTWSSLTPAAGTAGVTGGGTTGVYAMTYVNSILYIGGRFTQANGSTVNNIVAWTGSNWSALGSGVTGTVPLASWNVASPAYDAPVSAITNDGKKVYIGGLFTTANGVAGFNNIAGWDINSSTWSTLGLGMSVPPPSGQKANVFALAMHNGYLIAGGDFTKAGTVTGLDCIARWDGTAWSAMSTSCGGGINSDVFSLGLHQGNLYVGGQFYNTPAEVPPNGKYYLVRYAGGGPPMTAVSPSPNDTICSGTAVGLTVSGATTYSWTSSPAGFTSTSATPTVSPTTTTTYTVTGTTAGCSGTRTLQVVVNPVPTITGSGTTICAGDNTILTAGGASSYSWSPATGLSGTTTATVTSTPPAGSITYTVTGTDANGCTGTKNITVNVTSVPSAGISYAGPFCSNAGVQSVTLTGTAGGTYSSTPGLTINNSTGAVTPASSTPGTYTVTYTVAASGGCPQYTTTASITITALPVAAISYAGPFCSTNSSPQSVTQTGASGGTYTATPAGLILNSVNGEIIPNTSSPNTYTVTYTITGAGGCSSVTATASVTITALPVASISYAAPFCSDNAVPQAVTLVGNGGGNYTSSPAGLTINGATGAITPGTSGANTYTVTYTVASAGGCPDVTATTTVTITTLPTASISYGGPYCESNINIQNVTQSGATGGTYTSLPIGLSLDASTGDIDPSASNPNTYTVTYTIAGANGCGQVTATANVTITSLAGATISYAGPFCTSNTSPQTVTLVGTAGGNFSALPAGLNLNNLTGDITPSLSAAGTYTVRYVVNGTGGCPDVLTTANVTISTLPTAAISYTDPFCISITAAQAVTLVGDAGGNFSSAIGLSLDNNTGDIIPNASTAGTHNVNYTINGTGGCPDVTATTTVTINDLPNVTASSNAVTNAVCAGGSIILTGGGAITYSWTGGINDGVSFIPTGTLTYIVTGTDGNSCQDTAQITITVNDLPVIDTTGGIVLNPTTCSGSDGQITGILVTGSPVVTYSWNGGAAQASPDLTGLTAGAYTIVATDGNGCVANAGPYSLNDPTAPPAPTLNVVGGSVCAGGVLTLSINSPNPAATYSWTGPGGTLGTGASITIDPVTSADQGSYSVQATLAACTGAATSQSITVNPTPIAVITSTTGFSFCAGDSLALSAASSSAPVPAGIANYQWQLNGIDVAGANGLTYYATNGGSYTLIITNSNFCIDTSAASNIIKNPVPDISTSSAVFDSSNCNAATGGILGITPTGAGNTYNWYNGTSLISSSTTSSDLTGQSAGISYYLEVVSSFGCRDTIGPLTINNIAPPVNPVLSSGSLVQYCLGDTIDPIIAASTLGGNINWYSDAGLTSFVAVDTNSYTPPALNGTYYVTETASGCESTASIVTVLINNLPVVNANATQSTFCSGGSTILTGSGTAGVYAWNNGVSNGIAFGPVSTNTYTVTGIDLLTGCLNKDSIIITVNTPPQIDITSSVSDSSDCNGATGAITGINPNTTNNTYNWYNGSTLISTSITTSDLTNQTAGVNYYLEVIDQNGCKDTVGPLTINNIAPPTAPLILNNSPVYCQGNVINALTATTSLGGTINWYSDAALTTVVAANTNTFTPPSLTATYYVTETASGCESASSMVVVTVNAVPNVTANSSSPNGVCAGSALTLTGGGANSYTWNNSVVDGVAFTPTGTLTYIVTGTDAVTGCTDTASITVNVNPLPVIDASGAVVSDANCGAPSGGISSIVVSSGQAPLTYQWSNGTSTVGTSLDLNNAGPGTYTLTVTDANGCTAQTAGININATQGVIASFTTSALSGATPFEVAFTNTSIGAVNYLWDFGGLDTVHSANPAFTFDTDGTYLVCLTADNGSGCLDTACTTIDVYTDSYISIPNVFSPNDDGTNDLFYVKSKGLASMSGEIYDRWGLLMYVLEGVNSSWDGRTIAGTMATDGVYYYMIKAKGTDSKEYDKKGACTLVR